MSIFLGYDLECVPKIVEGGFDIIDAWRVSCAPVSQSITMQAYPLRQVHLTTALPVHFLKQKLHNMIAINNGWPVSKLPHQDYKTPWPT